VFFSWAALSWNGSFMTTYYETMIAQPDFCAQAFQKGDYRAFGFVFANYYRSLCYFASRLIVGNPIAEDIAQEAFVRLWQKHDAFSSQQSIKAFLYIITRNACLNFLKQWQREKNNREAWLSHYNEIEDHVLNHLSRKDLYSEIYMAIESLPEECKKIIRLSFLEGYRNHEIAAQLQLSIHTVKNQKSRGLYLLKKKLTAS
jgi:RNA polymerase sigma-70 factor (family 1)